MIFDRFFPFFSGKNGKWKSPLANRAEAVKFPMQTHEKKEYTVESIYLQ